MTDEQIDFLADTHLYIGYDTRHSGAPTAVVEGYREFARALLSASIADTAGADRPIMRFNIFVNLINPDPNGMYVRYEDHARAILAANGKKK
jgi:hypothetical protein